MRTRRKPTQSRLSVSDIDVEVIRKDVKYLRIAIYPPDGRVRVSVPRRVGDAEVHAAVVERLDWIAKHRDRMAQAPVQAAQQLVTGEQHLVAGVAYTLVLIEHSGRSRVEVVENELRLHVPAEADLAYRGEVLDRWYRAQLNVAISKLIQQWEPVVGASAAQWGIRKMKSRWGSCNCTTARLTFNLELAKKDLALLEYVVVHELTHLLERGHGPKFKVLMDSFLPDWRKLRSQLNASATNGPEPNSEPHLV
jgi:predicted metal-dependent hydrolase